MTSKVISQDLNRKKFLPLSCVIENLSDSQRRLLNFIIYVAEHNVKVYAAQKTIARYAGISREWCNKVLQKFQRLGLIQITRRGWSHTTNKSKTCLYRVASWFGSPQTRFALCGLLPALRAHSLRLFTQYIYDNKFIKTTSRNITTLETDVMTLSTTSNYSQYEEIINPDQKGDKVAMMNKKFPTTVWTRSPFDQKASDFVYKGETKVILTPKPVVKVAEKRELTLEERRAHYQTLSREEKEAFQREKVRKLYPRGVPLHLRPYKG